MSLDRHRRVRRAATVSAGSRGSLGAVRGTRVIDTLRLTAEEAAGLVERGEASGAELHRAYLDAIAERDPELHAYLCTVDEPEGDGVPIALKDVISTQRRRDDRRPRRSSRATSPVYDATVAARCKAAGLPLLGKTNMDEFAMGSSTENSAYGPTRNPWDPSRVPGGSSGGSTAAVAAGLAPWALGSDTGGSIKQPAALCGVVGLRPDLRHRLALRDRRLRLQPRPGRPDRQDRARLRAAVPDRSPAATRSTRRPSSCPSRSSCPRPRTSRACASACPRS